MAYIVTKVADTQCPLSRASFDRQRDIYKLAVMGNAASRRLWNDFAAVQPAMARLVIADINSEKARAVEADKHIDIVLKGKKSKKARKIISQHYDELARTAASPQKGLRKALERELTSPDPLTREAARKALETL